MGRRRKSDDAAGGFLVLLGLAVVVAIFLIRLAITAIFYSAAPVLLVIWIATFQRNRLIAFGSPDELDDNFAWKQIDKLQSERQDLFRRIHETYAVGFRSGLIVTAKSDNRLFHAGSRLGKKLNVELEAMYSKADTIFMEIRQLRIGVLDRIPNWRAPFEAHLRGSKLHLVSGMTFVILVCSSIALHAFSILPREAVDSASRILLWNPDPLNITGDLLISCGIAIAGGLLIWPFKKPPALRPVELSAYERWRHLEEKWSEPMEQFELAVEEDYSYYDQQDIPKSDEWRRDAPWFEILNVSENAAPDDIKRAYREAIRQYHPDKVSGLGERLRKVADEESKRINAAFSEAKQKRGFA